MSDRVETLLRQAMTQEADRAPKPADLAGAARARLARRRRTILETAGVAVVVVAVAIGVAAVSVSRDRSSLPPPAAVVTSPPPTPVAPDGSRLVGIGHAAIAVPAAWGTNQTQCGTPMQDTVIIDVGAIPACAVIHPAAVDSVTLWQGRPQYDFVADESFEIDGVFAERQHTTCQAAKQVSVCSGSVYLPSLKVGFRATSSTSPDRVDKILDRVQIVPDRVAVPGYQAANGKSPQEKAEERYLAALTDAGLTYRIQTEKRPAVPPGYVLGISPAPGTMLDPGATVTVMVVAQPDGPADEVRVDVNTENGDGDYRDIADPAIRAGATVRIGVGDRIWAYADGKRAATLAGQLDGNSLKIDNWTKGPNYPHSWIATTPGRTTITLTITADGQPITIGTVTVIVQ